MSRLSVKDKMLRSIARRKGEVVLRADFEDLSSPSQLSRAQKEYAEGRTTQIPAHTSFNTGQRRISRKITVGISTVRYENDYSARA